MLHCNGKGSFVLYMDFWADLTFPCDLPGRYNEV